MGSLDDTKLKKLSYILNYLFVRCERVLQLLVWRSRGVGGVDVVSTVDSVEWVRVHRDADERRNTTTRPHRNAYSFIPHTIHRAVSANPPLALVVPYMHTTAQTTPKVCHRTASSSSCAIAKKKEN